MEDGHRFLLNGEVLKHLVESRPARLAQLFSARAHELLRPELQVLGALLVELDRDRVLKVGEQLDDILLVGFPGEEDLL